METFCIILLQEQFHKCTILKVCEKVSKCKTISNLEQYQNTINQRDYILQCLCVMTLNNLIECCIYKKVCLEQEQDGNA